MYSREAIRVEFWGEEVDSVTAFEPLKNEVIETRKKALIHPASHYSTPDEEMEKAIAEIEELLEKRIQYFEEQDDAVAAQRIEERTRFDIEMMKEAGYCSGIENYAVHLSDRETGEPPYTLVDYFPEDFLTVIDESHQTIPQIKGQYEGDRSRKESLVENGFRLPTAFDNRPLTFEEFEEKTEKTLYVSATPGEYERNVSDRVAEQIVRPTYLLDPTIEVRETEGQVQNLIDAIRKRVEKDQRTLVTTLSTEMAENLTEFLGNSGVSARYMHHETDTLERHEIVQKLRKGEIDVIVGINLLREGLDIPEVSLVAILEADQEGFLRSETTLVQTMGRAARNQDGHVILYADRMTDAIEDAVSETKRRRQIQESYNEEHGTEPATVEKEITESDLRTEDVEKPTAETTEEEIEVLREKMEEAAEELEFEKAAMYRDRIEELSS
jgi:excinuclease ABC subunit B